MFRPLEARRIFLVWCCLVITCIAACQDKKLDDYECRCVSVPTGRRWHWNCYAKKPLEGRGKPSEISSTTDATRTSPNPLPNSPENQGTTGSPNEPRVRTQRVHSTKLSQSGAFNVQTVQARTRTPRETPYAGVRYIEQEESLLLSIEYEPGSRGGRSYLEVSCHENGSIETPNLLQKLKVFSVSHVGDVKIRNCPLPKNVTYGQILSSPENKEITTFSLITPKLDSPVLPKKPFEDFGNLIHEFTIMETRQRQSPALEDFEDGFFTPFTNLTFLSLLRNKISSTKALELIPNLKELNLSGNSFKNLTDHLFRNLTKLEWLHLVDCGIESIDKNAFATLVNLAQLDLFRNHLTRLPEELFSKTANLRDLSLNTNLFTEGLPENLFVNLSKLENFTCKDCGLKSLPPKIFHGTGELKRLDLSNSNRYWYWYEQSNAISSLDRDIFSETTNLRYLDVSRNNLTDIEGLILPQPLETLNLESNKLMTLPANLFDSAPKIKSINLKNTSLESLKPNTFSKATQLETLNLAKNLLTSFASSHSFNMINIETIDLSYNRLTSMPSLIPFNIVHFKKFDLRNNEIRYVRMVAFRSPKLDIDLRNNQLETIDVTDLENSYNESDRGGASITYTIDGPLKCDCRLLNFYRYYKSHISAALGGFSTQPRCREPSAREFSSTSLSEKDFRCKLDEGCPHEQGCSCDYATPNGEIGDIHVNCSNQNLQTLPQLPINVTEVSLEGNSFIAVPDFGKYNNLRRIDLSNNHIEDISNLSTEPNTSWEAVSLANNSIRHVGDLQKAKFKLDMTGNRFECTCGTWVALNEFFRDTKKAGLECDHVVNQTFLPLSDFLSDRGCDPDIARHRLVIMLVISIAILIVLLTVIYYKNRRRIIVYVYSYHYHIYVLIWGVNEIENDKTYDAFVSFSDHDMSTVKGMIDELEKPDPITGEKSYKLCLHYRDFIPGNSIVYNITHAVQNSCRTVLVLSENFISSVWLNVEFQTAMSQYMQDKSHKVIIVVLGELPSEKKLDRDLQAILKRDTYLKWGNPNFWNNLRYLLPHKKHKNKGMDKTKAVLNNYGHPMTRILLDSRPNSASVARTAETLENEKNRLKTIAQANGGSVNNSTGQINEAYVAISTEDISVHCDSFKDANKPRVTSGRHRPSSDNAVRPPRKKDKQVSEA